MIAKKISVFQKRNSVRRAGLLIYLMLNKKDKFESLKISSTVWKGVKFYVASTTLCVTLQQLI
jgi:hypothetical protein